MKQVGELLAPMVDPKRKKLAIPSIKSRPKNISKKWIAGLFKKFQARYGHKWTSAIDGIERVAVNEWCEGLAGFSADEISNGLEVWDSDWPPSLPEFKMACRATVSSKTAVLPAYRERLLAPPGPYSDLTKQERIDKARPFLQTLKGALGGHV